MSGAGQGKAAMDPAPRISVIIPHLNQAEALARCLAALAAQEAAVPFEVLVVDNGSATPPVVGPAARLLLEATPGPGPARNRGVVGARAPILAFLDADCVPAPGWIAAIAAHFVDPAAAVAGGEVRVTVRDPAMPTAVEAFESVFGYRVPLYIRRDGFAGTGNMAVRAEVFAQAGPFPGIGAAEDRVWGRRASAMGYPPAFLPAMRVETPARASFAELAAKWDRHVAHDYAELPAGPRARIGWCLRALAVAASPVVELHAVATSDRLHGPRARALAWLFLARIRLYRARRMLGLAAGGDVGAPGARWNRP
jgi:glycosyltransferase involved in cell wall biosynthesis